MRTRSVGAILLLSVVVAACSHGVGPALEVSGRTNEGAPTGPGRVMSLGIPLERVLVHEAVHLTSVELIDKAKPIEVERVVAFKPSELGTLIYSDFYPPAPTPGHRAFRSYPISGVVLSPGTVPDWEILVAVRSTEIGTHVIRNVRLNYRVGGKSGSQLLDYSLKLIILDCRVPGNAYACKSGGQRPRSSPPGCDDKSLTPAQLKLRGCEP